MSCVFDTPIHAGGGCIFDDPEGILDRTVALTLIDDVGAALPSLAALSWAWFDTVDPTSHVAPTDVGSAETTDVNGLLEIPLINSALSAGQSGSLVLRSNDGVAVSHYNLIVGENGSFIFVAPIHANDGCIFANYTALVSVPFDPTSGGGGYSLPGLDEAALIRDIQIDDERVIMAVIKKFLEMRRDA